MSRQSPINIYEIGEWCARSAAHVTHEPYPFLSRLPACHAFERRLGSDGSLNKLDESAELAGPANLVGIVVIGAFDNIEKFGWLRCLKDLLAKLERNNVVLIAVEDQFR